MIRKIWRGYSNEVLESGKDYRKELQVAENNSARFRK